MVVQKTYTVATKRISRDDNKVRADKQRRQFFTSIKAQLKILKQVRKLTYDKSEMAFLILRANFQLKSEATADLRLFIVFFFFTTKNFWPHFNTWEDGEPVSPPKDTVSHPHTHSHTHIRGADILAHSQQSTDPAVCPPH